MTGFQTQQAAAHGRVGRFSFDTTNPEISDIQTPFMFPVASFMTGTTPRGGGIWKYILQANEQHGLMRQNIPMLTQVLQFLDYGISPAGLKKWRDASVRGFYNNDTTLKLKYSAPIFLDSGGFKLMWRTGLDLESWGITLKEDKEAESILDFQLDLGGDIVASLDYPLPPNLAPTETLERMERSRKNAIHAARLLRSKFQNQNSKPFLYMAVHGLTPETIANYVRLLFEDIEAYDLMEQPFGLAIGSLVPLRRSAKSDVIMRIVRAAVDAIPATYRASTPVHVFGATGLLVPFLAYCGVDTSDSSTYGQEARALGYISPKTRTSLPILELYPSDISCSCPICSELDLPKLQKSLVAQTNHRPLPDGSYKSKFYADIAFHNLWLDFQIVEKTKAAIEANELDNYLIELTSEFPRLRQPLTALTEQNRELHVKATRDLQPVAKVLHSPPQVENYRSLKYTSADFNINANGYAPPFKDKKRLLLLLPCSAEKPYSSSDTHLFIENHLSQVIPDWTDLMHKVTLSGLYGPVPIECEGDDPVLHYDFRLAPENRDQIHLCSERLILYLERHNQCYSHYIAYATSRAYREVFVLAARAFKPLVVLPNNLKARKLTEFYRASNINELLDHLTMCVSDLNSQ